jgi:hypothetical protein
MGDWVAFEADYHDPSLTYGWSVIIKGRAHLLSANADILDAEEAPLRPWIATLKPIYVWVIAMEITGRRFKFRSRTGSRIDHRLMTAARTWPRNRDTTSAANCFRSRGTSGPPTFSGCGGQLHRPLSRLHASEGWAGEHAPGLLKPPPVGLLPIQVTFGPGTVRAAVGG